MKRSWQGWRVVIAVAVALLMGLNVAQAQEEESQEGLWYSVDRMNTGLPGQMDIARLRTPREAMRSFTELANEGNYRAAAHMLNLSDLSSARQRQHGEMLAEQLAEVLRRGKWLNISSLSGRRDAVIEDASGKDSRAGEARRDIELVSMDVGSDAYDIRLGRYRIGGLEPVWMITPESVRAIPALYKRYGPSRFESYIPDQLKSSFGLLRLWEWLAIPLVIVLLWLIGKAVHIVIGVMARWLPSGSPSIFVTQIQGPVAMIAVALVTQMLIEYVVSFSAIVATTLRVMLIAVMAWSVGAIALKLVDTFMLHMTRHMVGQIDDAKPRDDRKLLTTLYALRRVIILVLVISVTIYVLSQVQLFETLGMSILASASVLAVLVGVAGQAVLGNILSSFQLSLAKPVRIGDLVMFEGQWCYVEGIFYTYIRLRVWNERRLIVPVTYFASKAFENLSAGNTREYRSLELSLHLSADVAIVREKFLELAQEEDDVIEHHKLVCSVTAQTGSTQTITCFLMTSDPVSGWRAEVSVREQMLAFIRDHHPDWWPREVVVISQQDITRADVDPD